MLDGLGDLDHGHVGELQLAQGRAGLDEVEGDLEHGVAVEPEGDDLVGVLVQDDGDGAEPPGGEGDEFELLEFELFFLCAQRGDQLLLSKKVY